MDHLAPAAPVGGNSWWRPLDGFDVVATPALKTRVPSMAGVAIDANPENWARFITVSANTRLSNHLGLSIGLRLATQPFAETTVLRAADAFQQEAD